MLNYCERERITADESCVDCKSEISEISENVTLHHRKQQNN